MKVLKTIFAVSVAVTLSCISLVGCGGNQPTEPVRYTVSFDVNGGALVESETSVTVKEGTSITLPSAAFEGYMFEGWYNGTELAGEAGASYTPSASVTLRAEWEEVVPDFSAYAAENKLRSIEYAKLIRELYWDSNTKLSKITPTENGPTYLWPYGEHVAMVNGILLTMEETEEDYAFFTAYLEELIQGLRHYRVSNVPNAIWQNAEHKLVAFGETDGTANSYAIYNSGRSDTSYDSVSADMSSIYFDDNIWIAKELYYAYRILGKEEYLNEAINIVNWIVGEGYESAQGLNGIYWKWGARYMFEGSGSLNDNTHASLNACSSAPTAMMLAKLYRTLTDNGFESKFPGLAADYLKKAQNIYNFCNTVLIDPDYGCLRDKIFLRKDFETMTGDARIELVDAQILPYNTGTYMTAGAELYEISVETGKTANAKAYLKFNRQVAQDADTFFANTSVVAGQYSYNKNSWFTSFILEGFIDLSASVEGCDEYIDHMRSSLDYAWNNHRAEDKLVSPAWVAGWSAYSGQSGEDSPRQILLQAANAHCYAMLARYYATK